MKLSFGFHALIVGAVSLIVGSGCPTVHFTEKKHLSDSIMLLDDGAGETHFMQKTFYSREGSAGGIGATAGGGCGCY